LPAELSKQEVEVSVQTVEMVGPRNTRRLTIAGVALLAAGAVVVGLPQFGGSSGGRSSAGSKAATAANGPTLVYGMTKQQVQQITGAPTRTRGGCWLFMPRNGMVGKIPMSNTYPAGPHEGYLKLCFASGLFTSAARQILGSAVPRSPFPGGSSSSNTRSSGWTWTSWVQNPARGGWVVR
jgi:hypothetical protein